MKVHSHYKIKKKNSYSILPILIIGFIKIALITDTQCKETHKEGSRILQTENSSVTEQLKVEYTEFTQWTEKAVIFFTDEILV